MNKILFLLSLLFCETISATDMRSNLHALLICDTLAHKLKDAYLCDLQRMKENVEGIAAQSQLNLDLNIFTDIQVTSKNIEKWISTLHLEAKDVVLVYYVGRQDRHAKSKGPWPVLKAAQHEGFSASALAKKLKKHKPLLTLIFFDCYDRLVWPCKCSMSFEKIPTDVDHSDIGLLFTKAKGVFMACSCPKGKESIGQKGRKLIGGVFTSALITSIALNHTHPSWSKWYHVLKGYYFGRCGSIGKPLIYRHVKESANRVKRGEI